MSENSNKPLIGIIMGSDSDFPYMEKAVKTLLEMDVPFEIEVSSAHRTPERTVELVKQFEKNGVQVIIAAAGGAAHLAGVIAAHTLLPVLGVPITSALDGVDSLYSIVQMPGGIPVATFAIGKPGATNAVLFAMQILALNNPDIKQKMENFRTEQTNSVLEKSQRLKEKIASL